MNDELLHNFRPVSYRYQNSDLTRAPIWHLSRKRDIVKISIMSSAIFNLTYKDPIKVVMSTQETKRKKLVAAFMI